MLIAWSLMAQLHLVVDRSAVPEQPPEKRLRGGRAAGGRLDSAGQEGVPVVLPVRDASPGGSYGTATEGHVLCPTMFPIEVPPAERPDRKRKRSGLFLRPQTYGSIAVPTLQSPKTVTVSSRVIDWKSTPRQTRLHVRGPWRDTPARLDAGRDRRWTRATEMVRHWRLGRT
jgi:hypothetical protein